MTTSTASCQWVDEFVASQRRQILIGHDAKSGQPHFVSLSDLKETSAHILGASGYGKSFWLRSLIDQLVTLRQPFGLIDPHRELCAYALWRLRRAGIRPERIVLLDPGNDEFSLGFNPLQCGVADEGEVASLTLEAFLKAWGSQTFDQTPRLEGLLRNLFRLLIAGNLSLVEGFDVLNVDNVSLRRALRERVDDRLVRHDLEELEKLPRADKLAVIESARNRLRRVTQSLPVQRMLGQTRNPVNIQAVMDDGKFLIANLGAIAAPETQRLLGALLMNTLFHCAKRRNTHARRDWFLIADEFGGYATADFANALDQTRKMGLHLILAHQRMRQLDREDPDISSAVMTNCKIRLAFGGLEHSEAERIALELFTGEISDDEVKHVSVATKFRPVFDTFTVHSQSESESESESESWGHSEGTASGSSRGASESRSVDPAEVTLSFDAPYIEIQSTSESSSASSSDSIGAGRTVGRSRSRSSSIVPITRHAAFVEETGRTFVSLEEQRQRRVRLLHGLPKRHALVRVYDGPVLHIVTPTILRECDDDRLRRFETTVLTHCPHVQSVARIERQLEERRHQLTALADKVETAGRPFDVRSFRE